jgi:hypothetical protein
VVAVPNTTGATRYGVIVVSGDGLAPVYFIATQNALP